MLRGKKMSAENILILNVYEEMLNKYRSYQEPASSCALHQASRTAILMTFTSCNSYIHCSVSLCRSSSTANGWPRAAWRRRERPWLTAPSLVRSRIFSHSWPCRGPRQETRQLRATRASTRTASSLRATRRSTSPSR